ncbi:uncharacterized protein K452DRAFT_73175 [Aplosporella prunicola CBS 121167]|uniref:Carrier domain-containing protein n=1 Tax=Aplosporella prunicola CBS 121167 TaxID=1176127 RepID=A0A6A6BVR7_9PEZI|nr:uncharacterized protein K452DRAFT_73175 [Aplosporella prunicola CBS 121167]KAF2146957.1 hypothetical protein K452DRAFT_73175 [Aplosporella prunicola CBS 121167]
MTAPNKRTAYECLIHNLIEEHTEQQPEAEAVCSSNDDTLTYRGLSNASRRLAHHIVALGVEPEMVVPLCFEKSIWTVVAIVAVLRAGAAFVLLDPAHPTDRLKTIIYKTKAKIAITSPSSFERLSQLVPTALSLDRQAIERLDAATATSDPVTGVKPENAAYVVYTSGSTGQPKGALIEHGSFCSGALGHARAMHMDTTTRVVQFASYNFDASITEMLTTLVVGGTVCVIAEAERLDPSVFAAAATTMRANFALLTASFINALPAEALAGLKTLVQGGEALPEATLNRWVDKVTLMNAYGQVEASVVSTCTAPINRQSNGRSIGKAIAGRCWVVDPDDADRRTAQGEIGELLVEGPHVGRGYVDEPAKTAAVFIPRPIWHARMFPTESDPRALRFYRTGDLVVEEADGSFTFAGRKDEQVKVNGQRIELGEIEHQFKLAMQPPRDMIVELVKRKANGVLRGILVAFIAMEDDWSNDNPAAAQRLLDAEMAATETRVRSVLPRFMIPASFLAIHQIPVTINGKVDRKALRALGEARLTKRHTRRSSNEAKKRDSDASEAETEVRRIWSAVLNVPEDDISRTSVFQSLGGDSISAMQVVSQAATRGIRLTVQRILQKKTIEQITAGVTVERSAVTKQTVVEEEEDEVDVPFKLSPVQQLFFHLAPEGENRDNISFLLRLKQEVSQKTIEKALKDIVSRNSMLRARFFELRRGNWFQYISEDARSSFRLCFHSIDDISSELMPIVRRAQRTLDIREGPLVRVDLFSVQGGREWLLFLCGHHLVTDFVSWRIIIQELEEHIQTGTISSPKGFSFQRWCKAQEKHIRSIPYPELPFELPKPDFAFWGMQGEANTYGDSTTEIVLLDKGLSSTIVGGACNSQLKTEAVDMLLAGVMHAFSRTFPERKLPAFFMEGHGREPSWDESIDLSSTVGWFTTILPMLIAEDSVKNPANALRAVQALRAKFPDKGLAQFAAAYFGRQRAAARFDGAMEVTFNYAGMYQQLERRGGLFQEVPEHTLMHLDGFGPNLPRFGLVEILGNVEHGRVKLSFTFNKLMSKQDRVRSWMQECQYALQDMVTQLAQAQREFPLLKAPAAATTHFLEKTLPQLGVRAEDVEDVYPCSPMQHGMLLSRASERGSYISQLFFEAGVEDGTVEFGRLERAWQAVVDRHAALRTIVVESPRGDGTFDQVVLRRASAVLKLVDGKLEQQPVPTWAPNEPEHRLFVSAQPARRAMLRLDISHVLIDGSSTAVLIRDLRQGYDSPDQLANDRPLYSSYIEHVSTLSTDAAVDYWKQHLADAEPCHLPLWSEEQDGRLEFADVPAVNTERITAFCRQHGVTLSDLLKVAWSLVLRTYTGSANPVFGYLSSGRGAAHDDTVGVFANILACHARMPTEATVLDVLAKVQDDGLEQMPHQECSLTDVTHALGLADVGREGLFNTAMSLQKMEHGQGKYGLSVRIAREADPTEYSATFLGYVSESRIDLAVEYWTTKIAPAQARNIAATVFKALQVIIDTPQTRVEELDLLTEQDMASMMRWNGALESCLPVDSCIHHIIQQVAMQQPSRPAVHAWDGSLTYAQLDQLSSKLAGHLHGMGVGPEGVVAVCMEKSLWVVVSMLAVLKAGGAFVPLDPEAPIERLMQLVKDSRAQFVITSPKKVSRMQGHVGQLVVSPSFVTNLSKSTFKETVKPDNLAYVLFTSGSTGTPKGVMMQHSQFLASSMHYSPVLKLGPHSRVLQFSAYTFDASIFELWSTLTSGGCICQISEEQRMNDVTGAINSLAADTMFMTPTMLSMMDPRDIPGIKTVIAGGETFDPSIFRTWAPATRFVEAYGPTETAVYATFQTDIGPDSDRYCIGRSFCCRVWVVSVDGKHIMPIGAAGELWLEGPSLARGYMNGGAKAAAAFVTRPDWVHPEQTRRFYRTGDLVRCKPDGSLQFCGRKDTQVKIRGQRVELSEIEAQAKLALPMPLSLAAEVVAAKLYMLVDVNGVREDEAKEALAVLDAQLPNRLPRFMIPSAIFPVYGPFPRMSSGKLDRKQLRVMVAKLAAELAVQRPKKHEHVLEREGEQPSGTEIENTARQMLAQVLSLPSPAQIRLEDNFFRLGGDSFLAMKLVAAARARDLHLSVAAVLRNPVVRDLARCMTSAPTGSAPDAQISTSTPFQLLDTSAADTEAIRSEAVEACRLASVDDIEDIYPTTPLQEAFMAESAKRPTAYTGQHVITLPLGVDMARFRAAWARLVADTPVLRTQIMQTVRTKPVRLLQVVLRTVSPEWEEGNSASGLQAYLEKAKRATAAMEVRYGRPLARTALVQDKASGRTCFVWIAHHCLYDGWSLALMLQRLHAAYASTAPLAPTPSFGAYVAYLAELRKAGKAARYWTKVLSSAPAPTFPPSSVTGIADTVAKFQLRMPSSSSDVTATTALRTAWALLAANGADDVVFGSIVNGRSAPLAGVEAIAGPTIAAIPVRVNLGPKSGSLRELLLRVQSQAAERIPYEALGLQQIAALGRDAARACAFRNLFVVQPARGAEGLAFEVESSAVEIEGSYSYPLTVVAEVLDAEGMVELEVTYASAALSARQVEGMVRRFEDVLLALTSENKDLTVADVAARAVDATAEAGAPAPEQEEDAMEDEAPRHADRLTPMEHLLRSLWAEALGLDDADAITQSDDFFSLDGDSITAMQLSGIAKREGFTLRVIDIMEKPALWKMALAMTQLASSSPAVGGEREDEEADAAPFSLLPADEDPAALLRTAAADAKVSPAAVEDMYLATPLQAGLLTAADTQAGAYVARLVVDLPTDFDIERFKAAWDAVVATHPILRTRVVHLGEAGMFQLVLKPAHARIQWQRSADLGAYVARDRQEAIGFGTALVRWAIVNTGDRTHFVWTAHHAAYDGATVALLSEAVSRAYAGAPAPTPPPFARFVKYLAAQDGAASDAFWRAYLAGTRAMPFPLPRALDYTPRASGKATRTMALGSALRALGTTTATLIQTAWAYVLARHSGADDVVLGVAHSGRLVPVPGVAGIPGPLVATAPLRVVFDADESLASTLERVQAAQVAAIAHYHRGMGLIKRASEDAKAACELRSLLTLFPASKNEAEAEARPFDFAMGSVLPDAEGEFHTYPLLAEAEFSDKVVRVTATHDERLIPAGQAQQMLLQMERVLQQLGEAKTVRELDVFTKEEYAALREAGVRAVLGDAHPVLQGAKSAWVVDLRSSDMLASKGVMGELVIEKKNNNSNNNSACIRPSWLSKAGLATTAQVETTDLLARIDATTNALEIVGPKADLIEVSGRRFLATDVERIVSAAMWGRAIAVQPVEHGRKLAAFVALEHCYTGEEAARAFVAALSAGVAERLARVLPAFMVPVEFVPVRSLPAERGELAVLCEEKEQNGEKDGKEVEAMKDAARAVSDMESRLLGLWETVLKLDGLDVNDSFLRLGGDSLDAMQLAAAARRQGVVLTVKNIFDHPILADMAQVAQLKEEDDSKPQEAAAPFVLLGEDASSAAQEVAAACEIDAQSVEDAYPCTALQEGLMALSNVETGAYVAECVVPVPDPERLKAAWTTLVATTPILRTRIVHTDRWGCVQVVVREEGELQTGDNLTEYLDEARAAPMMPGSRLVRAGCITENGTANLVLLVHHALFDGWAWKLLLQRLHQLYQGETPPPPPPYSRFIEYLAHDAQVAGAEDFWRLYLEGADRTVFPHMPSSVQRPEATSHASRHIELARNDVTASFTTNAIVQTAWALLVGCYTDSKDVVLGVTLSGRTAPVDGIEDMAGPTFTTIPTRFSLGGERSVGELLRDAQALAVNPAQHIGLQRIRATSPSAYAACDFNSLLVVQPASSDEENDNFFLSENDSHLVSGFTNYSLVLLCQMLPGGAIEASIVFDPRVLAPRQAGRLLAQFEHVLHQLSSEDLLAGLTSFISPEDRAEIGLLNALPASLPDTNACLHEVVARHARTRPYAPAVCSWDGDFSYGELDALAGGLANYLAMTKGIRPGQTVPLCFEKTKWTAVAMLGVLKAGAAFVLLDPAYPVTRLETICRKVKAGLAVVSPGLCQRLAGAVRESFVMDADAAAKLTGSCTSFEVMPTDAAYVITTSGSSGEPKACIIEHRSIVAGALGFAAAAHLDGNTRAMQFASYSFDLSVLETIMVWAAGGCSCILSEDERKNDFERAINARRINWALMTPSLANLVRPASVPMLKTLVVGGEAATAELINTWSEHVSLLQAYGPCECTPVACCSVRPLARGTNPRDIGAALPGVRAWVVDPSDADRLAPMGSAGELVVEGPTVGRGYINEPEKEKQAFVAAPAWRKDFPGPVHRFYMTGDLVQYSADGTIEFVGRKDSQVKLRGQRLELAEIEHHLKRSMAMPKDVAVELLIPQNKGAAGAVLAAFVAVGEDKDKTKHLDAALGDAKSKLTQLLPSHMVPRLFVPLPRLPLLVSGKVDRKALRQMSSQIDLAATDALTAPRRAVAPGMEMTLQSLWVRVMSLEVGRVHPDADFFEEGGDSLVAMRLAAKARQAGVGLSVADVMRNPGFAAMAACCKPVVAAEPMPVFKPFESVEDVLDVDGLLGEALGASREEIEDVVEATSMQKTMTTVSMLQSQGTVNHVWLDFVDGIDAQRVKEACAQIVAHHAILRTVFVPHMGRLFQVVYRERAVDVEDRTVDDMDTATAAVVEESKLRRERFGTFGMRFTLLHQQDSHAARLVIRTPHALYDGVSLPLVLEHLRLAYARTQPLPPAQSFATYLRAWRYLQASSGAEAFWQAQLAGSSMTELVAPTAVPFTAVVNQHMVRKVPLALFARCKHSPETVLHAAWALALAQATGKTDVVFGRGVANRGVPIEGADSVVGPCLNTVPVRVRLGEEAMTAKDLLTALHDAHLASLPHEHLETGRLVASSTAWPRGPRFASVLVHNAIAGAALFDEGKLPPFAGERECKLGWAVAPWDAADLQLTSTPDRGEMRVDALCADDVVPVALAKRLLDALCANVRALCESPEGSVAALLAAATTTTTTTTAAAAAAGTALAVPPRRPLTASSTAATSPILSSPLTQSSYEVLSVGSWSSSQEELSCLGPAAWTSHLLPASNERGGMQSEEAVAAARAALRAVGESEGGDEAFRAAELAWYCAERGWDLGVEDVLGLGLGLGVGMMGLGLGIGMGVEGLAGVLERRGRRVGVL